VIVPFEDGDTIIAELFALPDTERCRALLQEAQQYSVNVYFNELDKLIDNDIVEKVPLNNGMEIYTVNKQYSDQNMGLTHESGMMPLCEA
jgi:CRISPR-associated endonuclease/helicase Cas3